ncbi:FecR domain-containing protein [Roseisolibacter sp. H3M3-2]|uniref:FecR family protein n=1 Tax=Roseisolibacter sp. H3M3-2 TaxID=3031323 RepID=UPI0023DBBC04|nr:FecR domain-containing protein [Roseisolibacter sp. H3M3-2]MDF1504938.1 FecR domain-containing protein [Roseisolibacter sp. H3M3-2]
MSDTPLPSDARDADAPPDWEALARYLAGESAPDEAREVAAWLAAHPDDAAMLRALDVTASDAGARAADAPPIDVEGALRRVQARRDAATAAEVVPLRPGATHRSTAGGRGRRWGLAGVAAAAVLALAVGLGRREAPAQAAARVRATAVGQRDSLQLADGSRVPLAPGSRVEVAPGYGDGAREVTLRGEAWFAVTHDEARPFRVRVAGAVVEDLGTEFAVRTDGAAARVAVAVFEGAVSLAADGADAGQPPVVLRAGDRGAVDSAGRVTPERGAAVADDAGWTRGRLVYRGTPLAVVQADLRRWYGVELRLAASALAGQRLTATFEGDPVGRVLDVLALAVGGEITRDGAVATLRRARAPR